MFIALAPKQALLIVTALTLEATRETNPIRKKELYDTLDYIQQERAKCELQTPEEARVEEAFYKSGLKAVEGVRSDRPLPHLFSPGAQPEDAEPDPRQPPEPAVSSMGSAYHLLKFVDALREEQPHAGALQVTSTSDILELIGQTLAASKCSGKNQALCQILSIRLAHIVNQLEET